jgi:hypothetical protein
MDSKGWLRIPVRGLDGEVRIPRRRFRCRTCHREVYAADGLLLCGPHRVTRPLTKRVCQLATVEHFTQLPQLVFDQHGVRLAHEELIELVHEVGGQADRLRQAEAQVWLETPPAERVWPTPDVTPPHGCTSAATGSCTAPTSASPIRARAIRTSPTRVSRTFLRRMRLTKAVTLSSIDG